MERYEDLGPIGEGAMGEVRRMRDRYLGRTVAMKLLKEDAAALSEVRERFLAEAATTSQLEHPGIIPIYDIGELQGRPYFTMKEIRGRPLTDVIRQVHEASGEGAWTVADGWSFRRLVAAFRSVCDAVAFAHNRGVMHRDLKPDNILVGDFGEVTVVDWGLATTAPGAHVVGTPAYMPPEQAWGRKATLRSDVYGLGTVLYEILSGWPPFNGASADAILDQVRRGTPSAVDVGELPIPEQLAEICEKAMSVEPEKRHRDAGALSAAMTTWTEGQARREKALARIDQAQQLLPRIADKRAEAAALENRATQELENLPSWAPATEKRKAWALLHTARELQQRATLMELDRVQLLRSALAESPNLKEANRALADHYRDLHARAEREHDHSAALRHEVMLRAHDDGTFADYLKGTGRIDLNTTPAGARVTAHRLSLADNAMQAGAGLSLGRTPLVAKELPMGSYVLELNAPGRLMVRFPVLVERQGRFSNRAPGERQDRTVRLPRPRTLARDEVLIPAGWFISGGDAAAEASLPRRRIWVEDLVAKVTPVSNRDYLAWLNALVERGDASQAEGHAPRQSRRRSRDRGPDIIFSRTPEGLFELDDGAFWQLDWPVVLVTWESAHAYARWLADQQGLPWRLPSELEWEKLARGVDARAYPWGDSIDPSFACVHGSHEGRDRPAAVRDFPWDTSPYGVRGLGGNAQDWCSDPFTAQGPALEFGRVIETGEVETSRPRVVRGGHWQARPADARVCARAGLGPTQRSERVGFRLVRSLRDVE